MLSFWIGFILVVIDNKVKSGVMRLGFVSKKLEVISSGMSHLNSGSSSENVSVQQSPGKHRFTNSAFQIPLYQSSTEQEAYRRTWLLCLVRTVNIILANFTDLVK